MQDPYLEEKAFEYMYKYPDLRQNIFRYLSQIGWLFQREEKIKEYIYKSLDEDSFFSEQLSFIRMAK